MNPTVQSYLFHRLGRALTLLVLLVLISACNQNKSSSTAPQGKWLSIFDGQSLDGWVVKIAGHQLGDNYANTFRVEDGILRVAYDGYGPFGTQFGGLYYKEKQSHYWLRVEYRFVGDKAPGGPDWGIRDSGIMMHTQAPDSLLKDQEFPLSIEMNFLGAGLRSRPTGDVCTNNGAKVMLAGALMTEKCGRMSTVSVRGKQWVTAEVEVLGDRSIRHYVNGELVAEYQQPQIDDKDPEGARLLAAGATKQLAEGYIALQSNSHPIEFRKVELLKLDSPANSESAASLSGE